MELYYLSPELEKFREAFKHCFELSFIGVRTPQDAIEKYKRLLEESFKEINNQPANTDIYKTADGQRKYSSP